MPKFAVLARRRAVTDAGKCIFGCCESVPASVVNDRTLQFTHPVLASNSSLAIRRRL